MCKKLVFILLMVGGFSPFVYSASFDCSKAGTDVEHLICDNTELSLLDEQLSDRYKKALEDESSKSELKKKQFTWLKNRNKCKDKLCLIKSYQAKISLLEKYIREYQLTTDLENHSKEVVYTSNNKRMDIESGDYSGKNVRPANMPPLIAADNDPIFMPEFNL